MTKGMVGACVVSGQIPSYRCSFIGGRSYDLHNTVANKIAAYFHGTEEHRQWFYTKCLLDNMAHQPYDESLKDVTRDLLNQEAKLADMVEDYIRAESKQYDNAATGNGE